MSKRVIPVIAFVLFHLTYSAFEAGLVSAPCLIIGCSLVFALWSAFWKEKKTESQKKLAAFVFYEATQTMVMASCLVQLQISALMCMYSTIVLATSETSPVYSNQTNIAICAKHITCWVLILAWTNEASFFPNGMLPILWCILHVMICVVIKKTALEAGFAHLSALKRDEARLQRVLQAVPDGIVVISEFNEIITHNSAFENQLRLPEGCSNKQLIAAISSLEYASEFKRKELTSLLEDIRRFTQAKMSSVLNFSPLLFGDRYLEWRGTVTQWDDRKACVFVVRDSTKWIELEKTAQNESDSKTAILRSVSHELRTPTNAILNLAIDFKESEAISPHGLSDISMIISATSFLLSLINDLMDFTRIVHDSFSLVKRTFQLRDFLEHTRMKIDYVKFTVKGSITIVAMLDRRSQLKISVEDTGIGIKPENISRIFNLFGKLDDFQNLNPQGCGLGLSISSQLVKKLGGSGISVTSAFGKGSNFTFCIDIQEVNLDPASSLFLITEQEISEGGLYNALPESFDYTGGRSSNIFYPTILIVDDSPFNRFVAQKLIEKQGYLTASASTGQEALKLIQHAEDKRESFKLVLMDIEMPEMNGLEATRELRRREEQGTLQTKLFIVGCSANFSEEDKARAIEAGMDNFIEKPIARKHLIAMLSQYVI